MFTKTPALQQFRTCFCCEKQIETLGPITGHPEQDMWNNGIVNKIGGGYRSKFDTNIYIIAICDDCIDKNQDRLELIQSGII